MSKSAKIITAAVGVIFLISIIALVATRDGNNLSPTTDELGGEASEMSDVPDLVLKDYEGNDVSLREIEGEILLLNSWASWCPFCVDEIPDFVQAQEELGDKLTVVLINREEPLRRAKDFSDSLGAEGRVITLLDPTDSFYKSIGGFAMPETLIVKEGEVILHKRGPMTLQEVELRVREALES